MIRNFVAHVLRFNISVQDISSVDEGKRGKDTYTHEVKSCLFIEVPFNLH